MDKINKLVNGKKQFERQILSDGVSATVLYLRQNRAEQPVPREEILRRYAAGEFTYELGIDPGMRTWNATVRRNCFTGEEVSENIECFFSFLSDFFQCKFHRSI